MREVTDVDIEDWIYMLNGGDSLQWAVIMAGVAVMLGVVSLIKMVVWYVKDYRHAEQKTIGKFLVGIALTAVIASASATVLLFVGVEHTRMSYFVSRAGFANLMFGAVLIYSVISFIKVKNYMYTMSMDAVGAVLAVVLSVISLVSALAFHHYEEENWYVKTEFIDNITDNTSRNNYATLVESDERVVFISRCKDELRRDIYNNKSIDIYVVYGEDNEPIVSFDLKENVYVGKRGVEGD